jgi:hypothetical protein
MSTFIKIYFAKNHINIIFRTFMIDAESSLEFFKNILQNALRTEHSHF